MVNQVSIAVIGVGRIGRLHAENLAHRIPGADLVAVSDVNPEALANCAADLGVTAVADHRAIMEMADVHAVAICSSTDTHAQIIAQAAAAGKHVFCEKPIALDLGEIDRALAAVAQARVKLQLGFNRRFDPNFRRLRDLVAEGKVGQPHQLRITSRDPDPPPLDYLKRSGGIFLDMTIHDFDLARYLIGDEVQEVFAAAAVMLDPSIAEAGDVDTATVFLRFRTGATGVIENSRRAIYGYDQRVEVFGSAGLLAVPNIAPDSVMLSAADGIHAPLPHPFFLERYAESYLAEMKEFVSSLLTDSPPPVTGRDGRIALLMGLAARKSHQENRPVKLAEIAPI